MNITNIRTAHKVSAAIQAELNARFASASTTFSVVSNPEFLKEGAAVKDFTRPDRIVPGVTAAAVGQQALTTLRHNYSQFNRKQLRTCVIVVKCTQFTKYAANAMLATRISLMNEQMKIVFTRYMCGYKGKTSRFAVKIKFQLPVDRYTPPKSIPLLQTA